MQNASAPNLLLSAPAADGPSRVLLLSVNQYDFPYPVFPLGAALVEAALRRAGHVVQFVDFNLNSLPLADVVAEFKPDYIGISLRNIDDALIQKRETFFETLLNVVGELRRYTRATIVLGGSGFSIFPDELLERSGADYGIQGEGESQFVELIDALNHGRPVSDLSGLVHRQNGLVRINPRSRMEYPDEIVPPEVSSELTQYYLRKSSMLNLQTQRGCALRCCYCTYPLLEGRQYRRRPAGAVVEELSRMQAQGARYVFIVDSVFNTSPSHVSAICEGILRRGLRLQWCCFLRPKNLSRDLMALMARAGLKHVEFGSDSFSDRVLDRYGKALTFDDILASSQHAAAANVDCAHFLILGGPGETEETLAETFLNSKRLPDPTLMARVGMRVYPGTPLFDELRARTEVQPLPPLLKPFYYIEPPLSQDQVLAWLRRMAAEMPNWIFDDPPPEYYKMAERLRARGIIGPLWSYFAMMQRLGGLGAPAAPAST
ncbi:MAG: cobalamin-dependent protein [Verrucomicrobia bacterium]|nr:cobalamin-dependent protein [Verrucomicrobiota bacterium]